MSETPVKTGAGLIRRAVSVAGVTAGLLAVNVLVMLTPPPAGADQVGSLSAQAKTISEELVQEQLQADAYQQQYSVASQRLSNDERAITATRSEIEGDRQQIAKRQHQVERLAIASYVLNGSVSSAAGASLFSENVKTVQSANEYATITIGNLNQAVGQLHTAQRDVETQLQVLVRQSNQDRVAQEQQANSLQHSTATVNQMQAVQAQVTGQLAQAVAAQDAAQARTAAAAVASAQNATAQKTTVPRSGTTSPPPSQSPAPGAVVGSPNTADPALNPFLQCVVQAESGGNYQAVSPNGLYMGAFQFSQGTWNYAAQAAGLGNLVGVPPYRATKAEQDTVAVALYALDGQRPWLGDRCS
jgi:peptidoglycan DL-endopeptidase CwlO